MKILLVAINAKYIHSNLAVYSLRAFADKYAENIEITELTINHQEEHILKEIYKQKADVVAFSCYIWNIDIINRIAAELKKVENNIKIWYGGPEVSYDAYQCLTANQALDGIMIGEGEQTFFELVRYYVEGIDKLENIKGLAYKESALLDRIELNNVEVKSEILGTKTELSKVKLEKLGADPEVTEDEPEISGTKQKITETPNINITPRRGLISLDVIPFPYKNINDFKNKIIYYESSRGCPFSCSYCLSSIDKSVRLRSIELVKKELKILLDAKVPQVKFVDRTFNCNKIHAMEIWKFVKENDNNITNFHFEISADLLTEEEIEFVSDLRPGQIQFEIGVQSTNDQTIQAIHRRMDYDKVKENVAKIRNARNIHQHLDLIAGLPFEDITSFERSFNDVYKMIPDQLQLGFLKVLKGSAMESERENHGINYRSNAPYEVLFTKYISYNDILIIKGICDMVEIYYNSAQFTYAIRFIEHFYQSPFQLYLDLSSYYENKGLDIMAHSRIKRYEIILNFFEEIIIKPLGDNNRQSLLEVFKELLILDLYLRENLKTRPVFAPAKSSVANLREICEKFQMDHRLIHVEQFKYDVFASASNGKAVGKETILIFDYASRDPLSKAATVTQL